MTGLIHAHSGMSNSRSDKCSADFSWNEFFKEHFPDDTAAWVASLTRTTVRAAEHMLARRNGPGRKALENLLRSSLGPKVLDAIAGEADWRALERRQLQIIELEAQLNNLELKRRELAESLRAPRR